jgi:hypothetical protein
VDFKIGICCFSSKNPALRSKSIDWLARYLFEWSNMSTRKELFQSTSTIKIHLSVLGLVKADNIIIIIYMCRFICVHTCVDFSNVVLQHSQQHNSLRYDQRYWNPYWVFKIGINLYIICYAVNYIEKYQYNYDEFLIESARNHHGRCFFAVKCRWYVIKSP